MPLWLLQPPGEGLRMRARIHSTVSESHIGAVARQNRPARGSDAGELRRAVHHAQKPGNQRYGPPARRNSQGDSVGSLRRPCRDLLQCPDAGPEGAGGLRPRQGMPDLVKDCHGAASAIGAGV